MPELSVLIPARNEMFLRRTVETVLGMSRADTEVIVVLDGQWADPPLPQMERLTVVYLPQSIGQRAATNLAAKLSDAQYVMKLDAHCSVAEGFDRELIQTARDLGRDVTQIPLQYNLHAFDWQCDGCGERTYQGPTPTACKKCGKADHHREMVWQPRQRRRTTAWRFDSELHFQYFPEFQGRPEGKLEVSETMSCLGACWFLERQRYWEIGGMDEEHGSWGQMGTELACKSWLSGGRMVTNHRTWFAHMFRTQGGDFGFPYQIRGSEVGHARKHSQRTWRNNSWSGQVRPLSWLVEHFWPVPGWSEPEREKLKKDGAAFELMRKIKPSREEVDRITGKRFAPEPDPVVPNPGTIQPNLGTTRPKHPTKGIVYYSDFHAPGEVLTACREQLVRAAGALPITSVTLKPLDLGQNIVLDLERGYLTMARQILTGLEASTSDVIFFCEHDVLYHPSHFEFTPPRFPQTDKWGITTGYWYNENVWKVDPETGRALFYYVRQLSGLCAWRDTLLAHFRRRVELIEKNGFNRRMGFEPGTHRRPERVDDLTSEAWRSSLPNVDVRHGMNLTPSRWRKDQFRNQKFTEGWTEADCVPGWGLARGILDKRA